MRLDTSLLMQMTVDVHYASAMLKYVADNNVNSLRGHSLAEIGTSVNVAEIKDRMSEQLSQKQP